MTSSTELAALLCSRLCHDLLSPVGALSNGVELLSDERDPEMRNRCMELLEQSARISAGKLKFFRLAYGAAGGFGEAVPVDEPRDLVDTLVRDHGRIELTWSISQPSLSKAAIKVLLNLAAIGIDALPRGGELEVGAESRNGVTEIAVRAAGGKLAFEPSVGKALEGSLADGELSGRSAPAHMIRLLAEEMGGGVQFAVSGDALIMGAVLPDAEGMIG